MIWPQASRSAGGMIVFWVCCLEESDPAGGLVETITPQHLRNCGGGGGLLSSPKEGFGYVAGAVDSPDTAVLWLS